MEADRAGDLGKALASTFAREIVAARRDPIRCDAARHDSIVNIRLLHAVIETAHTAREQRSSEKEASMVNEEKLAYVGRRAYELAAAGAHEDFAEIQRAIMNEGHAEFVPWLEKPGVIDAICALKSEGCSDRGKATLGIIPT